MKAKIKLIRISIIATSFFALGTFRAHAQEADNILTLPDALKTALAQQQIIKAKDNYARASAQGVVSAKRDGLPDVSLSVQQAYGTINGLNGLSSGLPGNISITSGPVATSQNWNAAFGSFYSTNINWNLFSFGLQKAHVADARGIADTDAADLEQGKFELQTKVAGAYLNLLSAQRLHYSMNVNLWRVSQLKDVILARTQNGLNPGVDSTIANAEVARARMAVTDAITYEQSQERELAIQMGISKQDFALDTSFVTRIPAHLPREAVNNISANPFLTYLDLRIKSSELSARYLSKTSLPKVMLFGALQDRGSGFGTRYGTDNLSDFNNNYLSGIDPVRSNYLIGIGITWNISDMTRTSSRVKSQHYISDALTSEYHYQENNLTNQLEEGNKQLRNNLQKYSQAPIELKAANEAYEQKKMLYANGLATIVDVTQALYNLNRAETDQDIASTAVWQSLLYISASSGELNLFLSQL
jgi:outer membrane protein TolC